MLLLLETTHAPATDLGFLLHKNPSRAQTFDLPFGQARVWYPVATPEKCQFALWLDMDPVRLSRGSGSDHRDSFSLQPYVNDRPYVASSFLCVAIAQVLRAAMSGQSKERPELAQTPIPLAVRLPVVPSRGGESLLRRLFEPVGYQVEPKRLVLDKNLGWNESPYYDLSLKATRKLSEVLEHLYVLLPVLDDDKHYWVGPDEVEKLLKHGQSWLGSHPERDLIALRYLNKQRALASQAVAQLIADEAPDLDEQDQQRDEEEGAVEGTVEVAPKPGAPAANTSEEAPDEIEKSSGEKRSLHLLRLETVLQVLMDSGARSVLDLGCGEGKLLRMLAQEKQFERIGALEVSHRALEIAGGKLKLERRPDAWRERIHLWHGSLLYRDARLEGFDGAAVVEVIEHLDEPRLRAFERVLWQFARPKIVVLTTPNRDYNVLFPTLTAGWMRHRDHRFEWSRAEFQAWAQGVAEHWKYGVRFEDIGPLDEEHGAPSQMGIWTRD